MLLKIVFAFILLVFVGISVCELSPYEWDSNIPVNNVRTFAKFLDDIYTEYTKTTKIDAIWYDILKSQSVYSDKQKRTVFNFTFVKWAAELAHFHLLKRSDSEKEEAYPNWNLSYVYEERRYFDGFLLYDKSLNRKIGEKFKGQIFAKEKQIDKKVVNQIVQLAFSLATRIMLSESYEENIFISSINSRWQLKSLLQALQNGKEHEENHCIFPFKLIETDENGKNHWWAQSLNPNAQNWSRYDKEQQQFIVNFKFVLNLSEFKLSNFEIFKLIDAIMNKLNETGNPPAVYTFMKNHFNSILSSSSETAQLNMNCAFINFGRELAKRLLPYENKKFMNYTNKYKSQCGGDVHKKTGHWTIVDNNSPELRSNQLELKLFKEPLWNYARVIGFDVNECSEMLQFCDTLQTTVDAALKDPLLDKKAMDNVLKMHELQILQIYLYELETLKENYIKLQDFVKNYKQISSFEGKKETLKELLQMLGQIHAEYSQGANDCVLFKSSPVKHVILETEIQRFGKVFYGILEKHCVDKVKYDERHQQLTFPESMGERIIQKLCAFLQRNPITPETDFDFIQLLQTVVLTGNGQMVAEGRKKIIKDKIMPINLAMYQLLFSLAFRLCMHIGAQNDAFVVEKYAPTLMSAWDRCYERLQKILFFDYQITVEGGMVQLRMPNWNLPYFVFSKEMSELKNEKVHVVNFGFLCDFSQHSTTAYEVIKMAQILHDLPDNDQILVRPSDPEVFVFVLERLQNIEDEFKRTNRDEIKHILKRLFENQNDGRTSFSAKGRFCILAHFVMELLAKARADYLPRIDFIVKFEAKTNELCIDDKGLEKENMANFGEKTMNFGKMIKLNSNLKDDIQRIIVPNLISGLEEMLKKKDTNYMNLKNENLVEWKLLEFEFNKSGQSQQWKEIENLLKECDGKINSLKKIKEKLERFKENSIKQIKKEE